MNRLFVTAPVAFLVSAGFLFAAAGPAMAADARCQAYPVQLREAAATAHVGRAKAALRQISVGEKLCEAGNERAGVKKFTAAMKTLGIEEAQQLAVLKR